MTTPIRLADYVARTLAAHGVRHAFLVTGGGAMHLNDAFGRVPGLKWVACHHEQACATAAEAYHRLAGRMAAVNVTTGPGGTNAITGAFGAWVDSLAMIVVSGQVRFDTVVASTGLPLRQLGDQEADIVAMVRPITKYAVMVTDPATIRYHLERALHLAVTGRPGPVWLDIPMNVQGSLIDPEALAGYDPAEDADAAPPADLGPAIAETLARLAAAERPVLLVGTGVRIAGAAEVLLEAATKLGIPLVTAFNAHDLAPDDHPCYVGRPGTVGDRAGNFAVQNADFLLVLGCRLNIRQIGYNYQTWARAAFKVIVDVDPVELKKPTVRPDLPVHGDAKAFLAGLLAAAPAGPTAKHLEWLEWCQERRRRYPVVLPEYRATTGAVNPYVFVEALSDALGEDEIVVTGDGTAVVATFQAMKIKRGQRLFHNSGSAPMGYDLPAAIGACFAAEGRRVVCVTGDGSIMMNLQELATIAHHRLPIKIFLLNNDGYHSIRQTQTNYFPDNMLGVGPDSGVGFPAWDKLAAAFGLAYTRVASHAELAAGVAATLRVDGPAIAEVVLDIAQTFAPKAASRKLPDGRMVSSPLEDLAPFLPREELAANMLIPPVEA